MSRGSAQVRTTVCQLASQYRSATDNRWMSFGHSEGTVRVSAAPTSLCPYLGSVANVYSRRRRYVRHHQTLSFAQQSSALLNEQRS